MRVPDHKNFQKNLRPDFSVQQSAESDGNLHQVVERERGAGREKMGQIPENFCGRVRILIAFVCAVSVVHSLPTSPEVLNGSAALDPSQNELKVTCADRSVLQWRECSISGGETLRFILPSKEAAVLNQVSSLAQIHGSLFSNGQIYFSAPGGVIIGKDAVIDVGSLLITTLDVDADAFVRGENFALSQVGAGALIQEGRVVAREGNILLIGSSIENKGSLNAKEEATLISCSGALIQADGKGILYIKPDLPSGGVINEGTIESLKTRIEAHVISLGVRHLEKGVIISRGEGGKVYIGSPGSQIDVAGKIEAPEIKIEGKVLGLSPQSSVLSDGT